MGQDSIVQLHEQYRHQSVWSQEIRSRFYTWLSFESGVRALEVGSGTGVITSEFSSQSDLPAIGLDIDPAVTSFAAMHDPTSPYLVGDGAQLPFLSNAFDVVFCHFLLLWTRSPARIMEEMVRVVRPGGAIAALAEPDYDARIDYPETLEILGVLQSHSLERRGADSFMGRRVRDLFSGAGLYDFVAGVLGGEWEGAADEAAFQAEWATIHADLKHELSEAELEKYQAMDWEATRANRRILFVPTFYAFGRVPAFDN